MGAGGEVVGIGVDFSESMGWPRPSTGTDKYGTAVSIWGALAKVKDDTCHTPRMERQAHLSGSSAERKAGAGVIQ